MTMEAYRYGDGSITYPGHPVGPDGSKPVDTVDLSEYTATVVTWTTAHATPPGVREPNHLAIVEFDVDGTSVRATGQLTTGGVSVGDEVRPATARSCANRGLASALRRVRSGTATGSTPFERRRRNGCDGRTARDKTSSPLVFGSRLAVVRLSVGRVDLPPYRL